MTGPLVRHFRTLAAYNRLANLRLYEACSRLGEAELKAQRSSFFGSIHGTLNHVMVGDRIWLARFAGEEAPSTNLDAILYEDSRLCGKRGGKKTRASRPSCKV